MIKVITAYRCLHSELLHWRKLQFPHDHVVLVDSDRYHGYGIARQNDDCPPDRLAVLVESGSVWWYPIEDCQNVNSVADRTIWPSWIKNEILERRKVLYHHDP